MAHGRLVAVPAASGHLVGVSGISAGFGSRGFLLMQRATIGVLDGKREAAESDARQAVSTAQQQLDAADLTGGVDVDKILVDLATSFANRSSGGQFETIILARGQTVTAGQADPSSIPANLREQVDQATPC